MFEREVTFELYRMIFAKLVIDKCSQKNKYKIHSRADKKQLKGS